MEILSHRWVGSATAKAMSGRLPCGFTMKLAYINIHNKQFNPIHSKTVYVHSRCLLI